MVLKYVTIPPMRKVVRTPKISFKPDTLLYFDFLNGYAKLIMLVTPENLRFSGGPGFGHPRFRVL